MTTVHRTASPRQIDRPGFRPSDRVCLTDEALIPVAAYLCVEGYWAPEYALARLDEGHSPAALVEAGLLEPTDELAVALLLSGRAADDDDAGADLAADEAALGRRLAELLPPIAGGAPEPYQPTDEDERWLKAQYSDAAQPADWPRLKDAADRRTDMLDVLDWFACHPGE